jgi:hypothetical protein
MIRTLFLLKLAFSDPSRFFSLENGFPSPKRVKPRAELGFDLFQVPDQFSFAEKVPEPGPFSHSGCEQLCWWSYLEDSQ